MEFIVYGRNNTDELVRMEVVYSLVQAQAIRSRGTVTPTLIMNNGKIVYQHDEDQQVPTTNGDTAMTATMTESTSHPDSIAIAAAEAIAATQPAKFSTTDEGKFLCLLPNCRRPDKPFDTKHGLEMHQGLDHVSDEVRAQRLKNRKKRITKKAGSTTQTSSERQRLEADAERKRLARAATKAEKEQEQNATEARITSRVLNALEALFDGEEINKILSKMDEIATLKEQMAAVIRG